MNARSAYRLLIPIVVSIVVVALWGASPSITGSAGEQVPAGVTLALPALYVATSPLSRLLDGLTLLSVPQSIWFLAEAAVLVMLAFALMRRGRRRTGRKIWAALFLVTVAVVAILETVVAFAPRPMASLRVADTDVAIVDFHSHTGASHDVRKSYTAEENRKWHQDGGFNLAWVTDHVKFSGAVAARARNPRLAGGGVGLLMGVEGRYHRIMSTIMLGLDENDTLLLNKRGNLLPGVPHSGVEPMTIVALPNGHLDSVTVETLDSLPDFVALELIDAAPRGLSQFDREEVRVRNLAARLKLTLVAASNNHGFGRTVAAWSLVSVPAWRGLTPDSAGGAIQRRLRDRNAETVKIIMRVRPRMHGASLPFTLPVLAFEMIGGLTFPERMVWIAWIWAFTAVVPWRKRA